MTVTLTRPYQYSPAGSTQTYPDATETALIAQGIAVAATVNAVTPGAMTVSGSKGRCAIAIGAASVVLQHPNATPNGFCEAQITSAAVDGTLTSLINTQCGAGTITITGNANATAVVPINWQLSEIGSGMVP